MFQLKQYVQYDSGRLYHWIRFNVHERVRKAKFQFWSLKTILQNISCACFSVIAVNTWMRWKTFCSDTGVILWDLLIQQAEEKSKSKGMIILIDCCNCNVLGSFRAPIELLIMNFIEFHLRWVYTCVSSFRKNEYNN